MKITDEHEKSLKLHNLLHFSKSKKNNKEEHADKLCFAQFQKSDTKREKIFISFMRINLAVNKRPKSFKSKTQEQLFFEFINLDRRAEFFKKLT